MSKYTADFETATWVENETWVWAYAICDIENPENIIYGNCIEDFMKWCENTKNPTLYFHNLKFDGEFIIYYLETHGFKFIENKKERADKTYTTLITDMGQFFSIEVYFQVGNKKVKKVTFYDSYKILPFGVDKIAKRSVSYLTPEDLALTFSIFLFINTCLSLNNTSEQFEFSVKIGYLSPTQFM